MSTPEVDNSSTRIFTTLPVEIISTIFGFLDAHSLATAHKTCQLFRDILDNSDYLWKEQYFNKWKFLPTNCRAFFENNPKWKTLFQIRHNLFDLRFSSKMHSFYLSEVESATFSEDYLHTIAKNEKGQSCIYRCRFLDDSSEIIKNSSDKETAIGFSNSYAVVTNEFEYLNASKRISILLYTLSSSAPLSEPITLGQIFPLSAHVFTTKDWVFAYVPQVNKVFGYSITEIGKAVKLPFEYIMGGIKGVKCHNDFIFFETMGVGTVYFNLSETPIKPHYLDLERPYYSELTNFYVEDHLLYLFTINFNFEKWDLEKCERTHLENLKIKIESQGNEFIKLSDYDGQNFIFFTSHGRIIIFDPINLAVLNKWYDNTEIKFLKIVGKNCLTVDSHANIKLWSWDRDVPCGVWHVEKTGHDDEFAWLAEFNEIVSIDFDGRYLKTLTQDGCYNVLDFLNT